MKTYGKVIENFGPTQLGLARLIKWTNQSLKCVSLAEPSPTQHALNGLDLGVPRLAP